jgi:hypothetical protein
VVRRNGRQVYRNGRFTDSALLVEDYAFHLLAPAVAYIATILA